MRIAFVAAGSGPRFYCDTCSRDAGLARALRARGHTVAAASFYLPVSDSAADGAAPLFCGAVGLSLRHRFPAVTAAPAWIQGALDARPLLALASRLSGVTRPSRLADLTLSLLTGEALRASPDLGRLLEWLRSVRPDVVHLANALLVGIAGPIRQALATAVTCSLQDEDTWIDALGDGAREKSWAVLRQRAAEIDLFVPVSASFAAFMASRLGLAEDRWQVVAPGIEVGEPPASAARNGPPAIGYLSRICESMGAGLLADAFLLLARGGRYPGMRLHFMGGSTAADAALIRSIRRRFARAGLGGSLVMEVGFDAPRRRRFLQRLTLLSVPALQGQAFGVFLLEAMAAGVPVVQPRLGGFEDLVRDTGGGVLHEPGSVEALASAMSGLLDDPGRAERIAQNARAAVAARYSTGAMAAGFESAFSRACRAASGRGGG